MSPANNKSTPLFSILIACSGGILVGFSGIFVRSSDLGPMTTGFYRLLFSLPFLYAWMIWERKKNADTKQIVTRNDYLIMSLAGLFFAVDLALWNWAIDYTAIVNATLLNNTSAFFVPLFMWIIFSEKITLRTISVAMFGFSGCILLVGESFTISLNNLIGDVVALFTGLMVTAYVITIKKIRAHLSAGLLMFWTTLVSCVGLAIFVVLFQESFWPLIGHLTQNDWLNLLGLAVFVHFMGQGFLAYSLGKISASYGAIILLLAPVTAAIFGWAIFGEQLSIVKLIGIAIIMVSIVAVKRA